MLTVLNIAALLFVIGVVIMALAVNASPPFGWGNRVAWILWAVAAILWYVTLIAR
jgi:hypothetical protein